MLAGRIGTLPPRHELPAVRHRRVVATFWALVSALEIDVWFEFVYSEANIADWPSRGDLGFVGDLGAREVRAVFPPLDQWGFADPMYVLSSTDGAPPPAKRRRRR